MTAPVSHHDSHPSRTGRVAGRPGTPPNRVLFALFITLATTGYPIAGLVTSYLEAEGSEISYLFRAVVLALGAFVASVAMFRKMRSPPVAILIFFLLYATRLYHDTFFDYLFGADIAFVVVVAVVLAPTIAACLAFESYEEVHHAWVTFAVAGVASLGVVFFQWLGIAQVVGETGNAGRAEFEALNPITIGYAGLFTVLAAGTLWLRVSKAYRPLLVIGGLIGVYSLIESASRGPLVSGLACTAFIFLVRGRILIFSFLTAIAAYGAIFLSDANLALLSRLRETGADLSSLDRVYIIQNSIDLAWGSPFIGHAYVDTISFNSPHNLLVESALAMGVVGLALMLFIQAASLAKAVKLARQGYTLLPLLVISALVNAQLSAFIWSSAEFWIPVTLIWLTAKFSNAGSSHRSPDSVLAGPPEPRLPYPS